MNRSRSRYLTDLGHIDERRRPRRLDQSANCCLALAIAQSDAFANRHACDADVMRSVVREGDRSALDEAVVGKESRYRGAIRALHHESSTSSRSICQPPFPSTRSIIGRSSTTIPAMIALPSDVSAARIAGSSETITDEM